MGIHVSCYSFWYCEVVLLVFCLNIAVAILNRLVFYCSLMCVCFHFVCLFLVSLKFYYTLLKNIFCRPLWSIMLNNFVIHLIIQTVKKKKKLGGPAGQPAIKRGGHEFWARTPKLARPALSHFWAGLNGAGMPTLPPLILTPSLFLSGLLGVQMEE
jgi:hypothetical protein